MSTLRNWAKCGLLLMTIFSGLAQGEDIDIFAGTTTVNTALPNVIFVLDNTSNWSRQSQQWPGGLAQGQSEVKAIKNALANNVGEINVGLVEFTTEGNAGQNGGFVRFDLQPLTATSNSAIAATLDTIYSDINSPTEKRNSGTEYGNLMYDFYNYLAGANQSFTGAGTPYGLADTDGYTTLFSVFESPLSAPDACIDTYLIFIGNPSSSGPTNDDATNSSALAALYTAAGTDAPDIFASNVGSGTPLGMPEFTTTTTTTPGTNLGTSASCWKSSEGSDCTAEESLTGGLCDGVADCSCTATSSTVTGCVTSGKPSNRTAHWEVETGGSITTDVALTGQTDATGGVEFNLDDWAKFLRNYGVPMTVVEDGVTYSERISVITYTIDVFNAQQNAETSSLLFSAADVGGGRYFEARSESEIETAINSVFGEILADSSSFAAVSLPVSATNRAQVDNEVYIGMFRPAPGKNPRWFGNLKRFQVATFNGVPRLADVNLHTAVVTNKGTLNECSESFWSTDTGAYWENLGVQPPPLRDCTDPDITTNAWSDLPDGTFVEKGGVAQQTRELTSGADRTIYTVDSGSLRALANSDATALGGQTVLDYLVGDVRGADEVMPPTGLRASIHGDVVHSRPVTIRYDSDTLGLFYGANDGLFRSVDPSDGSENWALIVPEHFSKVERLYDNNELVLYTGSVNEAGVTHTVKDYFFDGPTGQVVLYDADGDLELAYIYPTMRRGGRMTYALDVTDPDAPALLWAQGCPNLDNDTGCTTNFSNMGQTWSAPTVGYSGGYVDASDNPKLIAVFGGGFDDCLNEDVAAYPSGCSSAKGKGVYVVDAVTGVKLAYMATDAPVITELSVIDIDFDGNIDFAYVADVAGNLYRISFSTLSNENPTGAVTALEIADWTIDKIGATADTTRRFYNAPIAAAFQGTVFVTIGSGDRERPLEMNYPYASDVQNRFYVLIDTPYKTFLATPAGDLEDDEYTTIDLDGAAMLAVVEPFVPEEGEEPEVIDLQEHSGWYLDLADQGEQVANAAAIGGGKVFFNTFQPGGASTGLCERPKGIGTGYAVNLFAPEFTEGVEAPGDSGLPIPPVIATISDVPPGLPDCDGADCPGAPADPCASGDCEDITICIGCDPGFEPVEIIPNAPPLRSRVYFSEDIDRLGNQ
jgi:type IV pilus assembly protein PilY1